MKDLEHKKLCREFAATLLKKEGVTDWIFTLEDGTKKIAHTLEEFKEMAKTLAFVKIEVVE